jgi:hypothetical protein
MTWPFDEYPIIYLRLSAAAEISQTDRIEFRSIGTLIERKRFSSIEFISGARVNWREVSELR